MRRGSPQKLRRPPPRRPWWRGWVVLLLLGGIGWFGFQWWQDRTKPAVELPRIPPAVRTAPAVPPVVPPLPQVAERPTEPVPAPQVPPGVATITNAPPPSPPPSNTNGVLGPRVATVLTPFSPRPATSMLEAQIALEQRGIGSGSVDGVGGSQTATALRAFQFQQRLEETGRRDRDTDGVLLLTRPPLIRYEVQADDLKRLRPLPASWLGKSEAPRLDYESLGELIGEKFHAHPNLLRQLNPGVAWESVKPGTELIVPDTEYPPPKRAALVRISLAGRYLRAYDDRGTLLAHFPVSIGRVAEKRPVGALSVVVSVKDPNYTFDPAVFPESEEGRRLGRKLVIPPGPNNPVGVAWIGLSRPGYGIHGTPGPEQVGRTESHGCFRLANWNAEQLRQMVTVGTPVRVEK